MIEEHIKDKIAEMVKDTFEIDTFSDEITMENTPEWNSLKHLQLLATIEKTFGIGIDFRDVIRMTSVKEILTILDKYIGDV